MIGGSSFVAFWILLLGNFWF
ncbi:hypothetical protein POUND7_005143 [Theobroma cacao]